MLVEALEREIGCPDRSPVGHHPALVAPVALEDAVQHPVVAARLHTIDLVVRAHDRPRLTRFDRDLEGEQVAHAQRAFVDDAVVELPPDLGRIE